MVGFAGAIDPSAGTILIVPLVITAAHCLSRFPPRMPASYVWERTYEKLPAPLRAKPAMWPERLFVDPQQTLLFSGSRTSRRWTRRPMIIDPLWSRYTITY
jgi:hypothetical protein